MLCYYNHGQRQFLELRYKIMLPAERAEFFCLYPVCDILGVQGANDEDNKNKFVGGAEGSLGETDPVPPPSYMFLLSGGPFNFCSSIYVS